MQKLSLLLFAWVIFSGLALPDTANAAVGVAANLSCDKSTLTVGIGKGKLVISGSVLGEPEYDRQEFRIAKTEWWLNTGAFEGNCSIIDTKNQRGVWQSASSVECEISSSIVQKVVFSGAATVRYTFEKKEGVTKTPPEPLIVSGAASEVTVWFVGLHNYYDVSESESNFQITHNNTTISYDKKFNHAVVGTQSDLIYDLGEIFKETGPASFIERSDAPLANITWSQTHTPNCPCPIQVTPKCTKLCKGVFEVKGSYEDAPEIHLPVWNQVKQAGPKTQRVWQTVVSNMLKHEQEHEKIYQTYYRDHTWWTEWAKVKREVRVCVDDVQKAEEIAQDFLVRTQKEASEKYEKMIKDHDDLQDKLDDDLDEAGYPSLEPMLSSDVLLSE